MGTSNPVASNGAKHTTWILPLHLRSTYLMLGSDTLAATDYSLVKEHDERRGVASFCNFRCIRPLQSSGTIFIAAVVCSPGHGRGDLTVRFRRVNPALSLFSGLIGIMSASTASRTTRIVLMALATSDDETAQRSSQLSIAKRYLPNLLSRCTPEKITRYKSFNSLHPACCVGQLPFN